MFSVSLSLSSPPIFFSPFHLIFLKLVPTSSLWLYIQLSLALPLPYCQLCHLPIAPLPSRVRSRVLTLGFIQICSLRGWKVVMRAKKNSLALSLTTRLVFLMKPNENSIFSPCYSLPPILHLSFPACVPPYFTYGASNLQSNFLFLSVLV